MVTQKRLRPDALALEELHWTDMIYGDVREAHVRVCMVLVPMQTFLLYVLKYLFPGISAQIGHNGLRLPQTDALQASGNGLDYSPAHVLVWVTRRTAAQFMQRTNTVFVDF